MSNQLADIGLQLWVVGAVAVGTAFIILFGPLVTIAGVLLVIFGLLSLMPIVTDMLMEDTAV
jgi:hypothetical protein